MASSDGLPQNVANDIDIVGTPDTARAAGRPSAPRRATVAFIFYPVFLVFWLLQWMGCQALVASGLSVCVCYLTAAESTEVMAATSGEPDANLLLRQQQHHKMTFGFISKELRYDDDKHELMMKIQHLGDEVDCGSGTDSGLPVAPGVAEDGTRPGRCLREQGRPILALDGGERRHCCCCQSLERHSDDKGQTAARSRGSMATSPNPAVRSANRPSDHSQVSHRGSAGGGRPTTPPRVTTPPPNAARRRLGAYQPTVQPQPSKRKLGLC